MLNSRLKLILLDFTADGSTTNAIVFRPPRDREWRVIDAFCFHNDTSSRATYWQYQQESLGTIQKHSSTVAADIRVPITTHVIAEGSSLSSSLILRYNCYLRARCDSLGTGKMLKVRAIVEEYDGPND